MVGGFPSNFSGRILVDIQKNAEEYQILMIVEDAVIPANLHSRLQVCVRDRQFRDQELTLLAGNDFADQVRFRVWLQNSTGQLDTQGWWVLLLGVAVVLITYAVVVSRKKRRAEYQQLHR